jgi:hypothetical protein
MPGPLQDILASMLSTLKADQIQMVSTLRESVKEIGTFQKNVKKEIAESIREEISTLQENVKK